MYLRRTFATSVPRFFTFFLFSRRKESVGWHFVFRRFKAHVETRIGRAREFIEASLATKGIFRRHRRVLLQCKNDRATLHTNSFIPRRNVRHCNHMRKQNNFFL